MVTCDEVRRRKAKQAQRALEMRRREAWRARDWQKIQGFLRRYDFDEEDVNAPKVSCFGRKQTYPLHEAAKKGKLRMMKLRCKFGAARQRDSEGKRAIHYTLADLNQPNRAVWWRTAPVGMRRTYHLPGCMQVGQARFVFPEVGGSFFDVQGVRKGKWQPSVGTIQVVFCLKNSQHTRYWTYKPLGGHPGSRNYMNFTCTTWFQNVDLTQTVKKHCPSKTTSV